MMAMRQYSFNELAQKIHKNAKEKGFWDREHNVGEKLMLVTSELSEALEADRKSKKADLQEYYKQINFGVDKKEAFESSIKDTFEDEIIDAIIRLFDLCGGMGININEHIELKMSYNKDRERLHSKNY